MLEISDGCDVATSVAAYAARRRRSFCILSGSGAVADITIRQPGYSDISFSLQGCYEILSISGSFFFAPPVPPVAAGVTVFLARGEGEVVGGCVVGELRASGKVVVMAVSFVNAVYERLPLDANPLISL
ncbi:AT-hook motif nuclear-localized protein 23-like [Phalaenopsis equestris]|uniref:AT-hook motif nuclear-localized protein 23-like n=1 Tax=Phalaenopsis equestris TaxID=78828 RepID=UPI0009E1E1EE|nr:AT-hook motif nuclear-localized protein 23-like [Phalaenopsis equestris]